MNLHLSAAELLAGVGGLAGVLWVWRAGARRARAAADAARSGARLMSLAGRVAFVAVAITGVQWLMITRPAISGWAVLAVLGLPALFAAHTLTRALTITTQDVPRRRGGGRR
ncbi:MAG TPA: hypothetical protein VFX16_18125 [Pseudonocardiaceae bacterium]|nr:hypothetical protein [Pseudonocardiaceae bacterium]